MGRATTVKTSIARLGLFGWLGIVVGIVMPMLSALMYPVYMHQMQPGWAEWTRLMELPFVACELAIVHVAIRAGYRDALILEKLSKDVIVAFVLLLVGLTVSSLLFSKNVPASITLSITTLIHLRFGAAVFFLARSERDGDIRSLFSHFEPGLGIGLVALTILTVWKFQLPPPEWTVPGGHIEWASALPGFINVRHFGSWTGAIAAGLMVALLYGKREQARVTSLFYLLAAGLTCWSGTRAAVLAMAVVGLIAIVSLRRLPHIRALVRVGGLSVLAMLGAIVFSPDLPEFSLFVKEDIASVDAMASGRLELWHDTFFRWLDAPLFGWGSGSTFWEVNIGWAHTQPHNAVLQFLISWGIVGAAGALWLLVRAIVATHRTGMEDDELRPLTATLYSLLFMSLLEGMLYYPRFIMLIMIGFAVLFAARGDAGSRCGRAGA
ncbi:O-antigen ligase family protein [Sphingomonas sp. SUN019]|uniref:O-antigen ligase family protein n=1 Tax=Sphingomonas sp. SUN019 TaxID=2937788 RepID=UPI0021645F1E|nr:O-antigen ligase family protein [Sphingomonas sp. SUN019]UVO50915.1 O-antigen ligase family protein [Sphingomonas sp. SUN019]